MASLFLEKHKPVAVSMRDNMPHWHQDGKVQFVTFRLGDSLPQTEIREIKREIDEFNRTHLKPWDEATAMEYQKNIIGRYENYLNSGYGSCLLRHRNARQFVEDAIEFHNHRSCRIIAYVIMPNHLHILLQLLPDQTLDKIVQSLKRYSSVRIQRLFGINGKIWMRRYFDRMIRDKVS